MALFIIPILPERPFRPDPFFPVGHCTLHSLCLLGCSAHPRAVTQPLPPACDLGPLDWGSFQTHSIAGNGGRTSNASRSFSKCALQSTIANNGSAGSLPKRRCLFRIEEREEEKIARGSVRTCIENDHGYFQQRNLLQI